MSRRTCIYTQDEIDKIERTTGLIYTGNIADSWGLIPIFLRPAPLEDRISKIHALNAGTSTRNLKGEHNNA